MDQRIVSRVDPFYMNAPEQKTERRALHRKKSRGAHGTLSAPVITSLVQVTDLCMFVLTGLLSRALLVKYWQSLPMEQILLASLSASIMTVVRMHRANSYSTQNMRSITKQIHFAIVPLLAGCASSIVCLFLLRADAFHIRRWPFVWLAMSAILFMVSRWQLARLFRGWMDSGRLARRVAVVGAGEFSRKFIERLREEPNAYTIVGLYDDRISRMPPIQAGMAIRGTVNDLLLRSRQERIDVIVVALPLNAVSRIKNILETLISVVADVCLTADLTGLHYTSGQMSSVATNPVILLSERPFKDWSAVKKQAFDVVMAGLLLFLLSPLLIMVAFIIRLDSRGPILFRQPRRGFNNQLFTCFKFRTMHTDMTDILADCQTIRNDPRITRVGRWLRKSSLDELPQLFNVILGDMSLVGPRPHAPNTKAANQLFEDVVSHYAVRHKVKPGITGWAQVNGWRGETRTIEQIENRVACDLTYIERGSLLFDLQILALTIFRGFFATNAF